MAQLKGTLSARGRLVGSIAKSSGGTWNYPDLENLPQINGVTLIDNKTSEELGINIPTKTSDLENNSGFITSDALPTKTSDLENDSGFVTSSDIPTKVSELENDSGFITDSDLPTKVSDLENDTGFITSEDVPTKTSDLDNDSGYVTIGDVINDITSSDNQAYSSDKVEELIDSLLPVDTSSGAVATFSTDLSKPLVSLKADINAVQASGTPTPSTPLAISGWSEISLVRCGSNLCKQADIVSAYPTKYTVDTDGSIKTIGNLGLSDVLWTNTSKMSGVLNIIFVSKYQNTGSVGIRPKILYTDGTNSVIYTTNTQDYSTKTLLTTSSKTVDKIVVDYGTNNPTNFYLEVTLDTTVTDYEQYTGNTEVINLGDTYYGGYVTQDNNGVKLVITHSDLTDLGSFTWNSSANGYTQSPIIPDMKKTASGSTIPDMFCDALKVDTPSNVYNLQSDNSISIAITTANSGLRVYMSSMAGYTAQQVKSALTGIYIAYPLITPIEIDLPDIPLFTTLIGTNNIFADSGNIEVKYKESIQKYIDDKIAETQALIL